MTLGRFSMAACALALPLVVAATAAGEGSVGPASDGQPGMHRVGMPEAAASNLIGSLAYGVTEAQGDAHGLHQRFSLRLAGATAVVPWLNLAPALDGRFDLHAHDSGAILGGRLAARAFTSWQRLKLGAELTGWVPGAEQFSTIVHGASLDARALIAARFSHSFIAFNGGYRFDRSAAAGTDAARLAPGDRLALGLSDFDAVLLGIGGGVDAFDAEFFAEATSDWLVGSHSPSFSESPLRVAAGARRPFTDALSAEIVVEGLLSGRPPVGPSAPLVPIEPRATVLVGASYHFGAERRAPAPTRRTPPPPTVLGAPKPPPPAAPPQSPAAALELTVVDDTGAPVPGARARLSVGAEERDIETDASGHFREERLPPGTGKLVVTAPGFETGERPVDLVVGTPGTLRIELKALPAPSQVRGVVQSFGGSGLVAKIRIEPLGAEGTTGEDGRFELDVPPGSYDVVIDANGYQPQRRKIKVNPKGVVILNAVLEKQR